MSNREIRTAEDLLTMSYDKDSFRIESPVPCPIDSGTWPCARAGA